MAVPEGASLDAKMDLLLQMMPDVRRLSDLVSAQSSKLDKHSEDLNSLRKQAALTTSDLSNLKSRVLALEKQPAADVEMSCPPPPPLGQSKAESSAWRRPSGRVSAPVTFGSTTGPSQSGAAAARVATPAPPKDKGDLTRLHVTGFPLPLSHREMIAFVSDKLALPDSAVVVTRGFYSQRASLRFTDSQAADLFLKDFREAGHQFEGSKLYIQRDEPPAQRRMGFLLRSA
eukprot:3657308-Amphidinium_carterae.1